MITAVCDLDKNTAGGTTEEGPTPHTHTRTRTENKQDVNMLSFVGNSPKNQANNMTPAVTQVLVLDFKK